MSKNRSGRRHKKHNRSSSSTSYDYDGWYDPKPLQKLVKNIETKPDTTKPYNWVFRNGLTPEHVWIPVSNDLSDVREPTEFNELYMHAVERRVRYRNIKKLTLRSVEKASSETAKYGHRCPTELIVAVKEYLVNFLKLASKSEESSSNDLYDIFKKGLTKITRNFSPLTTEFVKTRQDTSIFSNRSQQETSDGKFTSRRPQKEYRTNKGDRIKNNYEEDYTVYWTEVSNSLKETYHPSSKMFY